MEHEEYKRLHALWYEVISAEEDHDREIVFWARRIRETGGSALELGSGTGRTYVPLLEQGFDIEGVDNSNDMMSVCVAACSARGVKPVLHEQSMLDLSLSRRFGLVFLNSGGLGLFTLDAHIHTLFEKVMAHLEPGGRFLYEFQPVPTGESAPRKEDRRDLSDGSTLAWRSTGKYDPASRTWSAAFVLERIVDGVVTESETNYRTGRFFTLEEALKFATDAGFIDVKAFHWLTEKPPRSDSKVITVSAEKPERSYSSSFPPASVPTSHSA